MNYVQRRRFFLPLTVIVIVLTAATAHSTTLLRLRFDELVKRSSAIARVRCIGIEGRMEKGEIWTDSVFEVVERDKGYLPAQIVVRHPGGKFQHLHSHVEDVPEFRPGEELYLFLWGVPGKPYSVLGWSQGVFRIHRDLRSGRETVTQDSAEIPVFDPESNGFAKKGIRNLRIDLFQERLHREIYRSP